MSFISNYKDLLVWQRSMNLVETVYKICLKLPDAEKWGLISQMQRSAVSVPSNIAEGFGRQATGEYRHHLSISRGSLLELETQLLLSQRLGYICQADIEELLSEITELSSMLASLISKLR
jgi:four helix bundle protein